MRGREINWWLIIAGMGLAGCTFNFDVTSQRTALENQVMGTYKELDDDLILASSVRGLKTKADAPAAKVSASKKSALDARQNQLFNQDDIDELKQQQILGEANGGTVVLLPRHLVKGEAPASKDYALAAQIAAEENRDRQAIWQRIIDSNEHLTARDLPNVKMTYAKMLRDNAAGGVWYQDDSGSWVQKPSHGTGRL